jgi:hypothetical protein
LLSSICRCVDWRIFGPDNHHDGADERRLGSRDADSDARPARCWVVVRGNATEPCRRHCATLAAASVRPKPRSAVSWPGRSYPGGCGHRESVEQVRIRPRRETSLVYRLDGIGLYHVGHHGGPVSACLGRHRAYLAASEPFHSSRGCAPWPTTQQQWQTLVTGIRGSARHELRSNAARASRARR